jgi:transposase
MEGIIPVLSVEAKDQLRQSWRACQEVGLKTRYLVILNLAEGHHPNEIAALCGVARCSVYRIAARFRESGEAGLLDRREDNGTRKLDDFYLETLFDVVSASAQDYGWRRPTWTREMLVISLERLTGVRIHVSRMSVALELIRARRGRPKPTVGCPWPEPEKQQRLEEIRQVVETLPADEVAVFEDEVDIHLNPKIGLDWMVTGQQKEVPTPGQNKKHYVAGAQDARTGEVTYVAGEKKNSLLFLRLLWALIMRYATAKTIHVILDNFAIHSATMVQLSLATPQGQRIQLHFLPPYCPDHNKIERTWQDLHANVTRNHTCASMHELMQNVRYYLKRRNSQKQRLKYSAA